MPDKQKIYHKTDGEAEMFAIDARRTLQAHPGEWSPKPWPKEAPKPDPAPAAEYEAKHRGGGSWSIMGPGDVEVLSKLTKDDAAAFNALSADERAEYVKGKS